MIKANTLKQQPSWVLVNDPHSKSDEQEQYLSLLEEDMEFSPREENNGEQQPSN
jgi:hypothetical protein